MTQIRHEHKETPRFQGNIVSQILGEMLTIVGNIVKQILGMWKESICVSTKCTMLIFPFGNNGIFIIHASTVVASG
jgi:hypothetical protein